MAATSSRLAFRDPESISVRIPGTTASAASTPLAKRSAFSTKLLLVFVSAAIFSLVLSGSRKSSPERLTVN
jgi:hypothetical protein